MNLCLKVGGMWLCSAASLRINERLAKMGVHAGTEGEREHSIIGRCWLNVIPCWNPGQNAELTSLPGGHCQL
jgi:hypothetical protein